MGILLKWIIIHPGEKERTYDTAQKENRSSLQKTGPAEQADGLEKSARRGSAARFFFCWVLLLASLLSCAAAGFCEGETQTEEESGQSVDPVRYPERCSGILYNSSNGMPTSEANAIAETDDGFIWIGSSAGLYAMTAAILSV